MTTYCNDLANQSVERYWKLAEELWSRYTNAF